MKIGAPAFAAASKFTHGKPFYSRPAQKKSAQFPLRALTSQGDLALQV
ncbi:hypothetical protein RCCS2_01693 [Roseobacter sp. CCS2]|nr:hypothetical protein RCCS2_01693 [Roseobacter sp. CCS2]